MNKTNVVIIIIIAVVVGLLYYMNYQISSAEKLIGEVDRAVMPVPQLVQTVKPKRVAKVESVQPETYFEVDDGLQERPAGISETVVGD